jgi:membrane-associated phospholipid phosphatase
MFFLIAVVVAYSRVYLSQHFMMDITAGSVTGVVFTFAAFVWFGKLNKTWLENSILRKYK